MNRYTKLGETVYAGWQYRDSERSGQAETSQVTETVCVQACNKVCLLGVWEDSALDRKFALESPQTKNPETI